jgi:hypothetical protein
MVSSLGALRGALGLCKHRSDRLVVSSDVLDLGGLKIVSLCGVCGRLYWESIDFSTMSLVYDFRLNLSRCTIELLCRRGAKEFSFSVSMLEFMDLGIDRCYIRPSVYRRIYDALLLSLSEYSLENAKLSAILDSSNSTIAFLNSVIENNNNIIYTNEEQLVLDGNSRELHNAKRLRDWLGELLLNGRVIIPELAFKLFHLMLKTFYGYEKMRYRWEWNLRNGKYVFKLKDKRRD